jgi:drug/metabolite transporter (DMT)-like permease
MLRPVWLILALLAAAGTAAREVYVKRARRAVDEFAVVFWAAAGAGALLLPIALWEGAGLGPGFWRALAVLGGINVAAALLIARAVHHSDLSLVAPLKSLTPLFMLVTAPVLIGEHATPTGVAGVAVIVAGAYLLSEPRDGGILAPYRALFRDAGAREMLVVALIFSVSAVVDKVGVLASGPFAWAAALNLLVAGVVGPVALLRRCRGAAGPGGAAGVRGDLAGAALVTAIALAAQMAAITMTAAAYVIAVKRTSVLFAVLAGGVVFGERGTRRRAVAALIMVAGFALVTVAA